VEEMAAVLVDCGGGIKKKKKTGGAAERREKPMVALGGCVGFLWWSWWWRNWWWCWLVAATAGRERERKNCRNGGRGAGFWPILDPIFSSIRSSMKPVFIGCGRG
jgi:hypothetical protein